jgi:hypothetical protein
MSEVATRKELIEQIYKKRKYIYPDIRRYNTVPAIKDRINKIDVHMAAIPEEDRSRSIYKKLFMEKQLLRYKGAVYTYSRQLPGNIETTRLVLELTDKSWCTGTETTEKAASNKMKQITLLLHFIFIHQTIEKLQSLAKRHTVK